MRTPIVRSRNDRKTRLERRRAARQKEKAEFVAANPTPYEDWRQFGDHYRERVRRALGHTTPAVWRKDRSRPLRPLTVDDLAAALYGVDCNNRLGFSYGQLKLCYGRCGITYHRQKAAAVLSELQRLDLIVLVANYSVHKRGNVFEVVQESVTWLGQTIVPSRPKPVTKKTHSPAEPPRAPTCSEDDDPFA